RLLLCRHRLLHGAAVRRAHDRAHERGASPAAGVARAHERAAGRRQGSGRDGPLSREPGTHAAGLPGTAQRMTKILFLPGSGASPDFWKPAGERLPAEWPKTNLGWPGLGPQPHDPAVKGLDDLIAMVVAKMDAPVDLVAQSMGGVIAVRIALAHPQLVRRLVLTVTSGGVDMAAFGATDWRVDYRKTFPKAA